jgi:hypothetical protein
VVIGGRACLIARYRPRLSAGRIAPHIKEPRQGFMSFLAALSALSAVELEDDSRTCVVPGAGASPSAPGTAFGIVATNSLSGEKSR